MATCEDEGHKLRGTHLGATYRVGRKECPLFYSIVNLKMAIFGQSVAGHSAERYKTQWLQSNFVVGLHP
jgi:hypothetical protein